MATNPRNRLLANLPREVYDRIKPHLRLVSLPTGEVIHSPGQPIEHLYFPTTCMISVTIMMIDGRTVEVGAVGSREVAGINAFMGGRETTQTEYVSQVPGDAIWIEAGHLKTEFNRNTQLRDLMLKYTQAFVAQISQNVGCNRLHEIERRCARWLLEVRERVESDNFPLTHEFIAQMLGVRRAGVSVKAKKLQDQGIIDYKRGKVVIKDVQALEAASCECYLVLKQEYDRLLGLSD